MGAGGALGCVPAGGVAERDGGGARDSFSAKLPKRTRDVLAMPVRERKRVIAERKALLAGRCAEEKLMMLSPGWNSRRSPSSHKACVQRGPWERTAINSCLTEDCRSAVHAPVTPKRS